MQRPLPLVDHADPELNLGKRNVKHDGYLRRRRRTTSRAYDVSRLLNGTFTIFALLHFPSLCGPICAMAVVGQQSESGGTGIRFGTIVIVLTGVAALCATLFTFLYVAPHMLRYTELNNFKALNSCRGNCKASTD